VRYGVSGIALSSPGGIVSADFGGSRFRNPFVLAPGETLTVERLNASADMHVAVEWEEESADGWGFVRVDDLTDAAGGEVLIPAPAAGEARIVPSMDSETGGNSLYRAPFWYYNDSGGVSGVELTADIPATVDLFQEANVGNLGQVVFSNLIATWGTGLLLAPGQSMSGRAQAAGAGQRVYGAYKTISYLP